MNWLGLAALFTMFAFSAVDAQEPVTLGELSNTLDELIVNHGKERLVEELSLTIADKELQPPLGQLLVSEEPSGQIFVAFRTVNKGKCTLDPPDPELLANLGFYIIEFCDDLQNRKNRVQADFHMLGNASGSLGDVIGSPVLNCKRNEEYAMMTPKARLFCSGT